MRTSVRQAIAQAAGAGHRRGRRTSVLVAAAVLAVPLVAACGSSGSNSGSSSGVIQVGVPPVVNLGDLYTADARGFFKDEGLDVKIKNINGGAQLVPALQAKSLQIGQSNIVSVLQSSQQKLDMKCFSGAFTSPSGPELALVVSPKDASITKPSELKGKTIAVNTLSNSNQLVAMAYLAKSGVDPSSVHFVALDYPDMPAAIASGRVAAAITDEPFTTLSVQRGAKVMAPQPDSVIAPHPQYACWVATKSWLDAHKTQAAKFVAALQRADDYMKANPAYLKSILPKYTSVSAKLAQQVTLPNPSTRLTADDVKVWSDAAAKFKITNGTIDPASILQIVAPAK